MGHPQVRKRKNVLTKKATGPQNQMGFLAETGHKQRSQRDKDCPAWTHVTASLAAEAAAHLPGSPISQPHTKDF